MLIAAGTKHEREQVLRDLAATMPNSTVFVQTSEVSEVLERAPQSSVVILGGELDELPAPSVMRMLGRRHPDVPVVCLDAPQTTELTH